MNGLAQLYGYPSMANNEAMPLGYRGQQLMARLHPMNPQTGGGLPPMQMPNPQMSGGYAPMPYVGALGRMAGFNGGRIR